MLTSPISEAAVLTEENVWPSSVPLTDDDSASEVRSVEIGDGGLTVELVGHPSSPISGRERQEPKERVEDDAYALGDEK